MVNSSYLGAQVRPVHRGSCSCADDLYLTLIAGSRPYWTIGHCCLLVLWRDVQGYIYVAVQTKVTGVGPEAFTIL